MKKIVALLMVFTVFLTVVGCSQTPAQPTQAEPTAEPTAAPTTEPTVHPQDEPPEIGGVEEQTGSVADHNGWWSYSGEELPFMYLNLQDGVIATYDEAGTVVDEGSSDYDEQRHLTGNPLMVFTFDEQGEYGVVVAHEEGETSLQLISIEEWPGGDIIELAFMAESPF